MRGAINLGLAWYKVADSHGRDGEPRSEEALQLKILTLTYEYPPLGGGGAKVVDGLSRAMSARVTELLKFPKKPWANAQRLINSKTVS